MAPLTVLDFSRHAASCAVLEEITCFSTQQEQGDRRQVDKEKAKETPAWKLFHNGDKCAH